MVIWMEPIQGNDHPNIVGETSKFSEVYQQMITSYVWTWRHVGGPNASQVPEPDTLETYLCTIQYKISATRAKLGVRKFSTDMRRGYPNARMISVKSVKHAIICIRGRTSVNAVPKEMSQVSLR